MTWTFRPAVREQIRLLISLAGGTGSGKTKSAMEIAKGLSGSNRFAVIDTENGRASMYAPPRGGLAKDYPGTYDFDVVELVAPFTSERYEESIMAAEDAGYPVILVDSGSHEWEGDGGMLEQHGQIIDRMIERSRERGDNRKDWQLEEAHGQRAWGEAKGPHKKMKTKLLQLKAHVIFCFRAEDKIEMAKENGKTVIRPKQSLVGYEGWIPICEKRFPYEMTVSFMLLASSPGIPKPIKLQSQHRPFFPLDKPITEEAGRLIGEWAKGGSPKPAESPKSERPPVVETKPGVYEPKRNGKIPYDGPALCRKIESARTIQELQLYGEECKTAPVSDKDMLRDLYAVRMKQLKNPQSPDIPDASKEGQSDEAKTAEEFLI